MIRSLLSKFKYLQGWPSRVRQHVGTRLPATPMMEEDPFATRELASHQESWIEPQQLGSTIPPYRPTYPFDSFINENHARFASCPAIDGVLVDVGIPGWLRREDALKIYELAYYSPGDVLEIGTYEGLSTSIISTALTDAGKKRRVLTVDMSPEASGKAVGHLRQRGLEGNVDFFVGDAAVICESLSAEARRFSFVFVDHSHEYQPVAAACRLMDKLIYPRGFCLFHDFNDARNNDPDNAHYGVSQAVHDALPATRFEFHGIFGCAALYRAKKPE